VQAVVIGHISVVVVFQGQHIRHHCVHRDAEFLQQVPLLGASRGRAVTPAGPERPALRPSGPGPLPVAPITWNIVYMIQLSERPPA
jgi:hypothetical protein